MFEIKPLPEFDAWINALRDPVVRARLIKRLVRAAAGNLGDVRSVGEGVSEMREHFGTGWRMYFVQRGQTIIVMLGGGDKTSQQSDIAAAIKRANALKE
jgi:putative addiction module killer protein